jgi:SAM-dependent methyltransferase
MQEIPEISDAAFKRLMSGERIYGDDFDISAIETWYRDEEKASYAIYDQVDTTQYDALNWEHGFRHLVGRTFHKCLGLGIADGKDIEPLARQVGEFIAIEPEEKWWRNSIGGRKATYLKPSVSGEIPLETESVDLAVALSVLHHIPNVSFVIKELARVLRPSGILILREPVVSMGDWRFPRPRTSPRERGIPPRLFLKSVTDAGLRLTKVTPFDCPVIPRFSSLIGIHKPYNKTGIVKLDKILSSMLKWNMHYHSETVFQKIAPASYFVLAEKK